MKEPWERQRRRAWVEAGRCAGCGGQKEDPRERFCAWCAEARNFTA
jgi:hypothetical protein